VTTNAQVGDDEFEKPYRPFDYSLLKAANSQNKRVSKQMDKYESANSVNRKESSKNEMTLKKYLKRNKILRFGEKMQNVSFWKRQ
jgi:hypothetical protein